MNELYFDNNATTPLDEIVLQGLKDALDRLYGNASSPHPKGEEARAEVERARSSVAALLGATSPTEIIFTSGGTESIHTALHIALAQKTQGLALTSSVEHAAVLRPLEQWEQRQTNLVRIGVDGRGRLDTERLLQSIETRKEPLHLVALLLANNETGVLLPFDELEAISKAAREAGALVHLDAVQAPGKLPLQEILPQTDLLSLSAHKLHGPKGVGALFVRRGVSVPETSFLSGGPQERELRAGTLNVPGIVGFGIACERAQEHLEDPAARETVRDMRDRLESGLSDGIEGLLVHGLGSPRLDNTTNVGVPGIDGELLRMSLAAEGLCLSGGAACSANTQKPSPILIEMGVPEEIARASLRFSLSRLTKAEEVEKAIEITCRTVQALGAVAPS